MTVTPGEFVGDHGRLDAPALFAALRGRVDAVRVCVDQARQHAPEFNGRIGIELSIGASGHVSDARVSGLPDGPVLGPCITRVLRAITVPTPGVATVRYRSTFTVGAAPTIASAIRAPASAGRPVPAAAPTIDRTTLRRTISQHHDETNGCYEYALQRDPSLSGQVVIRLVIGGDGHVTTATVDECATGLESVGECVASRALSWTFPAPDTGQPVTTTYPFTFASSQ